MSRPEGLYQKLRILEIVKERDDFITIVFEKSQSIRYKAGQYLTLVKGAGSEEIRRSYSILSAPALNEPLAIGIKRVENGAFSRKLVDNAKKGDEILTIGNGGFFVLPDEVQQYRQLFFFAAGSGITPILSLIKEALHAFAHLSIVLIYSNASVEKALYLPTLQELQKAFPERFHLEALFSNSVQLSKARLHRDLILSFLQQRLISEKEKTLFYICGPESYLRLCTYTLQEEGMHSTQIKKENFFFADVAKRDAAPPDTNDQAVTILLNNKEHRVLVRYPNSILQAAKKEGLILPYSCEAGRCGNCVAKCVKGTVWHSYNEVLTEKELQKGLVLTCVGHPVGGGLKLVM